MYPWILISCEMELCVKVVARAIWMFGMGIIYFVSVRNDCKDDVYSLAMEVFIHSYPWHQTEEPNLSYRWR